MENKFLFYQAVSALPEGFSLSDYEWNFYKDNAGKQILTVTLTDLEDGQTLVYDEALEQWVNGEGGGGGTGVTVTVGTEEPVAPTTGDIWFDTTDDTLYLFDGTVFAASVGPVGPKGDTGDTGPAGPSGPTGVVAATLPITYDSGTQTVGFDGSAVANLTDVDYIDFDTTASHDPEYGQIAWDEDFDTLSVGINGINLPVGQKHVVRVKNSSGIAGITKGQSLMFAGATGDTITATPAISNGSYSNEYLIGIAAEDIAAEDFGFVAMFGYVTHLKTDYSGWALGSLLYVDPNSPGTLTVTKPTAPAWSKPIAAVSRVHENSGRILVRALPGDTIDELHNVEVVSAADGDFLVYDGSKWVNESTITWGQLAGA
jgi:hypothetical protein